MMFPLFWHYPKGGIFSRQSTDGPGQIVIAEFNRAEFVEVIELLRDRPKEFVIPGQCIF